jgi:hypothetical protein
VIVRRSEKGWKVEFRLKKLQPEDEEFTYPLYLRAHYKLTAAPVARIYADNIREPILVPYPSK